MAIMLFRVSWCLTIIARPTNRFTYSSTIAHMKIAIVTALVVNSRLFLAVHAQNPALVGEWSQVFRAPMVPVAAANLPDGRVVYWSAHDRFNFRGRGRGETATAILDPQTGQSTEEIVYQTDHDMFCPGTAALEDGRIMVTGGNNAKSVSIYDPATNNWTKEEEMNVGRGYHSMMILHDGSVFTVGGSWSGGRGGKYGELWDPDRRGWVSLQGITTDDLETSDGAGVYRSDNHMWLFQSPRRKRILQVGPSRQMHWIFVRKRNGRGLVRRSISRANDIDSMNGNAVMYDVGKILTVGGAENYDFGPGSRSTHIVDMSGKGEPIVRRVQSMLFGRAMCSSVVLPSGQVFTFGGQSSGTFH